MEVYVWLAVTAVSVLLEFTTMELVSIWFVGGGIVSMILAFCDVGLVWQIVAFIIVSLALLLSCRKACMKFLLKKTEKTNTDSIIGKEYALLTAIGFNEMGSINVNGVVWSAVTETQDGKIEAGKIVEVLEIRGNKLVVKEI